MPTEILNKRGPLDDDEWETMRRHTIDRQRMLDQLGGTLHDVGAVVRASHDRCDGNGCRDGSRREEIPPAARAVAAALAVLERDLHVALTLTGGGSAA